MNNANVLGSDTLNFFFYSFYDDTRTDDLYATVIAQFQLDSSCCY